MVVATYLPFFLLAGSVSVLIILALGTIGLAGARGGRRRLHWRQHEAPPLPDPPLGRNRREVRLRDADPPPAPPAPPQ